MASNQPESHPVPPLRSAVVLSIDGLGARYLGPYGNTSLSTPACNRLAGKSVLFETALARIGNGTTPDAWGWSNLFDGAISPSQGEPGQAYRVILVSDGAEVLEWGETWADEVLGIESEPNTASAMDLAETRLARFFARAIERLQTLEAGELLILHTTGLTFPWDAPISYREALRGEDDPAPPSETEFSWQPGSAVDPESLFGWQTAYGAQLAVLDDCLELFLDALDSVNPEPLYCFTSPRAFPIGEHGFLGPHDACVYDDALHVPLMIRHSSWLESPTRVLSLVYADHWIPLLRDWLAGQPAILPNLLPEREREILFCDGGELGGWRAVRTQAWKLLVSPEGTVELYVKPDDRWEKNDIADRCRDVVEQLRDLATDLDLQGDVRLPEILARGVQ